MKKHTILICATGYSAVNVLYTLQTGNGGFMSFLTFFFLVGVILYATTHFIMWVVPELVYLYKQRRLLGQPTAGYKRSTMLPNPALITEADPRRFDPHVNVAQLTRVLNVKSQMIVSPKQEEPTRKLETV